MTEQPFQPIAPRQHLGPEDFEVLEFELTPWKYQGAKEAAIRERFGYSLSRYLQRLHWIAAQPDAAAYNPDLVNRIHTRRRTHHAARTEGMTA